MAMKALGKNSNREVGRLSAVDEAVDGQDFKEVYVELYGLMPKVLQEVFVNWVKAYAASDVNRLYTIFNITRDAGRTYGESFVNSFYICGVRWRELNFVQFCQIFKTMDQAYEQKTEGTRDTEGQIRARHAGANTAAQLMRNFLRFHIRDAEKIDFLREVLIREGEHVARDCCFLLQREDFHVPYFEQALPILNSGSVGLSHLFLDACENWRLTNEEAIRLSANIVCFLNEKDGDRLSKKLLQGPFKPEFLGEGPESVH